MEDEGDGEEEKEDEVHLSCMKISMLIQHEGDRLYKSRRFLVTHCMHF